MEAFSINPEVFNMWLFLSPPVMDVNAPCFCTEDCNFDTLPPTMRGEFRDANYARRYANSDKIMLDLATRAAMGEPGRWIFHVVCIDRPPDPEHTKPVKVHFFNNNVKEVGSAVFHVPIRRDCKDEDTMDVDSDDRALLPIAAEDTPASPAYHTGRPDFSTAELMKHVREFINKNEALRAQLLPSKSPESTELPLRLVDACQSRIQEIARFDANGNLVRSGTGLHEGASEIWEGRG